MFLPKLEKELQQLKLVPQNPRFGYSPTQEEREAARLRMINNNPMSGKGTLVYVWLSDKVTLYAEYVSKSAACKGLGVDSRTLAKYLDSDKLYRDKYYLSTTKNITKI